MSVRAVAEPALRFEPDMTGDARRGFDATRVWVFDLDNTLYPSACNLFAEVDHRMGAFIAQHLDLPLEHARYLQKRYYHDYGTTLTGLIKLHKVDPHAFLDFVHDIDLAPLSAAPELAAALAALPGRRIIFTNGSRRHAERVAEKLGVLHLIEDICDIAACEFVAKPAADAFKRMTDRHGVAPARGGDVRGHAAQPRSRARARHDDRARAFRLSRSSGAGARCAPGRSCRSTSIMLRMI